MKKPGDLKLRPWILRRQIQKDYLGKTFGQDWIAVRRVRALQDLACHTGFLKASCQSRATHRIVTDYCGCQHGFSRSPMAAKRFRSVCLSCFMACPPVVLSHLAPRTPPAS